MEGPRGARIEDRESLRTLTDIVFRKGMLDQYVQLFNEANYDNLRVCAEDGNCVCHVGMTERRAILLGCPVSVACIGGVSTHPEFRKRGLASACFDDARRKARDDGVDYMIVSGDRNLYRMRGCVHVGSDRAFTVSQNEIPAGLTRRSASVTVEVMTDSELPRVMECYRGEPVRFARPPDDYLHVLESGWVMNRPSDFLVVREQGVFRGYIIAARPRDDGKVGIAEFAGDRHSILAALPQILKRYGAMRVEFQALRHDALMRSLCEREGLEGSPRATAGTVTLINFPQLMERIRPLADEMLGARLATRLQFRQEEERFVFAMGDEELITDRSGAAQLLFGTVDRLPAAAGQTGDLGFALRTFLPLPTLWYGINYV